MSGRRAEEQEEAEDVDEESGEEDEDEGAGPRRYRNTRGQHGHGWDDRREPARARERGLTGLPNLGNTCYLNSAMQALIHIEPFNKFFLECPGFLPYVFLLSSGAKGWTNYNSELLVPWSSSICFACHGHNIDD